MKKEDEEQLGNILIKTLREHFLNGFRSGSPIELFRLRKFVAEDFGEEIDLSDEELNSAILSRGTLFDGKLYIVGANVTNRIKSEIDTAMTEGAEVIFYSAFYEKNEDWLFSANIISKDMLKNILVKLCPRFAHTMKYFALQMQSGHVLSKVRREVLRVWGADVLLSYEQLSERLPYVPVDKIKNVLAQNKDFIWNSEGVYTHISSVDINDEERAAITNYVAMAYRKCGYASLSDIPLGEIVERNCELTLTAVRNATFEIIIADKYDRRGKIVMSKGDTLDALSIMKEHCRSLEKCTLQELLNFERELTGEAHRWIPMEAGNTVLVRIDKDTYLADKYVHFNADIIDEAIGLFVKGDYLPLKSFTTFGAFPDCGQTWNLFILESYCRRFSRKFRFGTPSVNSRNAGAIIRKSCGMDYTEIMTCAVANADVPLKEAAVGKFLYESGYTGRKTTAQVNEIIDKARAIRERMD
ncbi:MAG: hypothetical protein EPN93_03025 [Spirochaetes bacterium]|nr:MAG: hypothetical protein EPN93_03025 [Spirochaetota bacterium]